MSKNRDVGAIITAERLEKLDRIRDVLNDRERHELFRAFWATRRMAHRLATELDDAEAYLDAAFEVVSAAMEWEDAKDDPARCSGLSEAVSRYRERMMEWDDEMIGGGRSDN